MGCGSDLGKQEENYCLDCKCLSCLPRSFPRTITLGHCPFSTHTSNNYGDATKRNWVHNRWNNEQHRTLNNVHRERFFISILHHKLQDSTEYCNLFLHSEIVAGIDANEIKIVAITMWSSPALFLQGENDEKMWQVRQK